jgi:hypothetical protein
MRPTTILDDILTEGIGAVVIHAVTGKKVHLVRDPFFGLVRQPYRAIWPPGMVT